MIDSVQALGVFLSRLDLLIILPLLLILFAYEIFGFIKSKKVK